MSHYTVYHGIGACIMNYKAPPPPRGRGLYINFIIHNALPTMQYLLHTVDSDIFASKIFRLLNFHVV